MKEPLKVLVIDVGNTGCRLGNNAYAFLGGFRMWEEVKP